MPDAMSVPTNLIAVPRYHRIFRAELACGHATPPLTRNPKRRSRIFDERYTEFLTCPCSPGELQLVVSVGAWVLDEEHVDWRTMIDWM